jgi:hypothetical protein
VIDALWATQSQLAATVAGHPFFTGRDSAGSWHRRTHRADLTRHSASRSDLCSAPSRNSINQGMTYPLCGYLYQ